jgi:hypothetical protein
VFDTKTRQTRGKQRTNTVDLVFWILQDGGAFDRLILFSGAVYYENVSLTPILLIFTATFLRSKFTEYCTAIAPYYVKRMRDYYCPRVFTWRLHSRVVFLVYFMQ